MRIVFKTDYMQDIRPWKDGYQLSLYLLLLVVAIAALGMKTSLGKLTSVGGSAIVLICALTVALAGYSIGMIEIFLM